MCALFTTTSVSSPAKPHSFFRTFFHPAEKNKSSRENANANHAREVVNKPKNYEIKRKSPRSKSRGCLNHKRKHDGLGRTKSQTRHAVGLIPGSRRRKKQTIAEEDHGSASGSCDASRCQLGTCCERAAPFGDRASRQPRPPSSWHQ